MLSTVGMGILYRRDWSHAEGPSACGNLLASMSTAKHDVELLLNKLPEDCTLEDIQYHLYVLEKVRRGLAEAHEQGSIPQSEVEVRLSQWLTE